MKPPSSCIPAVHIVTMLPESSCLGCRFPSPKHLPVLLFSTVLLIVERSIEFFNGDESSSRWVYLVGGLEHVLFSIIYGRDDPSHWLIFFKMVKTTNQWMIEMGLSENRVYSQWNSHLIGIMISKTIGYNGVHNIFRHTHVVFIQWMVLLCRNMSQWWLTWRRGFCWRCGIRGGSLAGKVVETRWRSPSVGEPSRRWMLGGYLGLSYFCWNSGFSH